MKPALLFLVILIPFSGCRKTEKKVPEQTEVHEINIAIPVGIYNSEDSFNLNKRAGWETPYFWHLNLLNDSFYIKKEFRFTYKADSIYQRSGKFNLKDTRKIERFITFLKSTKNGQAFINEDNKVKACGFPLHIIQYRKGSASKVIFFDNENTLIRTLTDLTYTLDTLKESKPSSNSLKQREILMTKEVNKILEFKNLHLPPPRIGAKIKFTPPKND